MNTWLVADWHLGEDRFDIMQRPFTDAQEHVDVMVANHNALVKPDDFVYVNGDVLYQKANPAVYMPQIARFNGHKVLLRGNHDRVFCNDAFSPYFDEIHAEGVGVDVELDGLPCHLVHYPTLAVKDRFNIVGHIHSAWKFQLNSLNIGVDVHHFHPVNANKLSFFLKAISEFYDYDVWAAYNEANQSHWATRGKKETYFTPQA